MTTVTPTRKLYEDLEIAVYGKQTRSDKRICTWYQKELEKLFLDKKVRYKPVSLKTSSSMGVVKEIVVEPYYQNQFHIRFLIGPHWRTIESVESIIEE